MATQPRVTVIGGGMITEIQLLPTLYQLQRDNVIGELHICALQGAQLAQLQNSPTLKGGFKGHSFTPYPDPAKVDPKQAFPDLFKEVFAKAPRGSIAVVATPDHLHYPVIKEALANDLHVCTVKPLVLKHAQAEEIAGIAAERGLVVGVEYHKRFDTRNLMARKAYRDGKLGTFRLAQAQLMEPWYYRDSNFQNWCTVENSDMFTYVGCHYVDIVAFITGLKPTSVSVYGIRDKYPNGREGFLWTDARVIWNNGAALNVQNSLSFPDAAPGTNTQGLTMYCKGADMGALLHHSDQYRGMKYSYTRASGDPGSTVYAEPSPDYFQYVDLGGPGLTPVGYGLRSVEHIVENCIRAAQEPELAGRQTLLREMDAKGIMATPANSSYNERLLEAGRKSILNGGVLVEVAPA